MIKLDIKLTGHTYPIYITDNFTRLGECLKLAGINGKVALITDTNVDRFHSKECIEVLESAGFSVSKHVIEAGETNKTLETVQGIYEFLLTNKFDRSSAVAALGGGVTGDIAGFAAATYLRGVKFVQVPTSLLAQADSSVGGKTGVDFKGYKNVIGSFYQPSLVYINVNTLRTLPLRELRSGLAEVIKHGVIFNEDFFDFINRNISNMFEFDVEVLKYISEKNCELKGMVVEKDEKEQGLREVLNFGHTIGHAIESAMEFEMLHGECVSIGMSGAFKMAEILNLVNKKETERIENLLKKAGLPVKLPDVDREKVYNNMIMDKKARGGKLTFILPEKIGKVIKFKTDDKNLVMKVLNTL
ncbi:MAG TPA: 3-dehydroquinate synthase [Clostridiaceae bacterium]|nr:3-dehydroquinate synthase [Clostridiaceae bacterium]